MGLSSASLEPRSEVHTIEWRRAAGTARQVVDLVSADINLKPTYEKRAEWEEFGKRTWGSSWFPWWKPSDGGTYAKVPVVGTLLEEKWVYRHAMMGVAGIDYEPLEWSSPLFANGTTVPQGELLSFCPDTLIDPNPRSRVVPFPPPCAQDHGQPIERRGLRDIPFTGGGFLS